MPTSPDAVMHVDLLAQSRLSCQLLCAVLASLVLC